MANLSLKLITNKPTVEPDTVLAQLVIPAGFSYTTAVGGSAVDLSASAIADPGLQGGAAGPNSILPDDVDVSVEGGNGYYAQWTPGSTLQNGKLVLFQPGGAEVGTGVLGAPWTNATCKVNFKITIDPDDHQ